MPTQPDWVWSVGEAHLLHVSRRTETTPLRGLRPPRLLGTVAMATALVVLGVATLPQVHTVSWQDCNLMAQVPALRLLSYTHSPDPIVHDRNNSISKRWQLMPGLGPLRSLREHVTVSRRKSALAAWEAYFENTFDLCASSSHPSLCSGSIGPGSNFTYEDEHPPSRGPFSPHYQAIEHYYVNGVFAGCATVVYDAIDSSRSGGTAQP